jgi:hypothetical protein
MYPTDPETGKKPTFLEFQGLAGGSLLIVETLTVLHQGSNRKSNEGAQHQTLLDDLWIIQRCMQEAEEVTYVFKGIKYIHWNNLIEATVSSEIKI